MLLRWRATYDVHDCPDCRGEHLRRQVWADRGQVFVLCPRTFRRIRIHMRRARPASPGRSQPYAPQAARPQR